MLNLRDPKIVTYPTESDTAYGSPSSTELTALTAVVMNDMTAFQTRVDEQDVGELFCICCRSFQVNVHVVLQAHRLSGLFHGRETLYTTVID